MSRTLYLTTESSFADEIPAYIESVQNYAANVVMPGRDPIQDDADRFQLEVHFFPQPAINEPLRFDARNLHPEASIAVKAHKLNKRIAEVKKSIDSANANLVGFKTEQPRHRDQAAAQRAAEQQQRAMELAQSSLTAMEAELGTVEADLAALSTESEQALIVANTRAALEAVAPVL